MKCRRKECRDEREYVATLLRREAAYREELRQTIGELQLLRQEVGFLRMYDPRKSRVLEDNK